MSRKLAALAVLVAVSRIRGLGHKLGRDAANGEGHVGDGRHDADRLRHDAAHHQPVVKRGKRLYAVGTATSFAPTPDQAQKYPSKTVRRAFTAPAKKLKRIQSAKRICPVLDLTLGPLDLNCSG
jgi:hypothetical protein